MKLRILCASALLSLAAGSAHAVDLFVDNFDANSVGLNKVPAGWSVSDGSVDIIGTGLFDLLPGNGAYVDLDGSSGNAGVLSRSFSLLAGESYTASFTLAGSRRGDSNTVDVDFGTAASSFALASADGPTSFSLDFAPTTDGSYALSFENLGGDNLGALLLDVRIEGSGVTPPIPEPGTYAMMLAGLATLGLALRRRTQLGIFSRQ